MPRAQSRCSLRPREAALGSLPERPTTLCMWPMSRTAGPHALGGLAGKEQLCLEGQASTPASLETQSRAQGLNMGGACPWGTWLLFCPVPPSSPCS